MNEVRNQEFNNLLAEFISLAMKMFKLTEKDTLTIYFKWEETDMQIELKKKG